MSFAKKMVGVFLGALILVASFPLTTLAEEPYDGYNYDWWLEPIPSQNGYVPDRQVTGLDLGIGAFVSPSGMFISHKDEMYIADSGFAVISDNPAAKGRIVKTNVGLTSVITVYEKLDFSLMGDFIKTQQERLDNGEIDQQAFDKTTSLNFSSPHGIFVDDDDILYIADKDNTRVIKAEQIKDADDNWTLQVKRVYTRPNSEVYDDNYTFEPRQVVVDAGRNVFVNIQSITKGAVVFREEGVFNGYYGANRVQATAEVLADKFWQMVLNEEQLEARRRNVAAEFTNFDIDEDGFIYTVTSVKSVEVGVLKKLNSAGYDVFNKLGFSDYVFGDFYAPSSTRRPRISDVDIAADGTINLLDEETGRVFQYDKEADLLFIFGGKGSQKGTFNYPNAIESHGTNIYVMDGNNNNITVFKQTEFGALIHDATGLFNRGRYEEAKPLWEEILRRDANYWYAYIGLGNSYLQQGEYEIAMDYFYMNSRSGYNRAFKQFRMNYIRDNFDMFATIALILVVAFYAIGLVRKRQKIKKQKLEAGGKRE